MPIAQVMHSLRPVTAVPPPCGTATLVALTIRGTISARDGEPVVAKAMSATVSCDHLIIDGAAGAHFPQVLAEVLAAL